MPAQDSPPSSSPAESWLLLQKASKWTPEHLERANVRLVENADILPDYLPEDGDPEFEKLAAQLCQPSREQLEVLLSWRGYGNPFQTALHLLPTLVENDVQSSLVLFKQFLSEIIRHAAHGVEVGRDVQVTDNAQISFQVPQLVSRAKFYMHGVLWKNHPDFSSIPLAVFSVVKNPGDETARIIARHEVPQALVQAMITYTHNCQLGEYSGLVVSLEGPCIRVSRAIISQAYMEGLCNQQRTSEKMHFYRSRPFELLDRDDRREFMRLLVGILRYLGQSALSTMPGDYPGRCP